MLANLVLGSNAVGVTTPGKRPSRPRCCSINDPYVPIVAFAITQFRRFSGSNSFSNTLRSSAPGVSTRHRSGSFRVGRMPNQLGSRILENMSDGYDIGLPHVGLAASSFSPTVIRASTFTSPRLGVSHAGPTTPPGSYYRRQLNLAQLDDVNRTC